MKYTTTLETPRYPWKEMPGSSHDFLLSRILAMPAGLRVLDLGFGAGLLARRIRSHCSFLGGIELDPDAAREGAPYFDRPILGDLLEGLRESWGDPFDVVVAGDILEHLPDPAAALDLLRSLLAPTGRLLISLPNVANVTVRLSLLAGRFDYQDRGILDRTHLRFFTAKTGERLLSSNGFTVLACTPTAMPVELAIPFLGRPPLGALVRWSTLALARLRPTLFAYQLVFEARRA